MVSCQKGPTRHAYAWQIGPFWQDTIDMALGLCKGLHDKAPTYIQEMITPSKSKRYPIRSNEERVLKVPKFKHDTFGKRAFAVYGPLAWNFLTKEIRLCDEIEAFQRNLKTHLFVKFVNESTLAIWFWRIIVKRPRMLSAQFVALYKPCKPKPKPKETVEKSTTGPTINTFSVTETVVTLQWRHNEHHFVSNYRHRDCLFTHSFRRKSKNTSKLRFTDLLWGESLEGNPPVTGTQRASNAENVSFWWRHHVSLAKRLHMTPQKGRIAVVGHLACNSMKTVRDEMNMLISEQNGWYFAGNVCNSSFKKTEKLRWTEQCWFRSLTQICVTKSKLIAHFMQWIVKLGAREPMCICMCVDLQISAAWVVLC